MSMLRFLSKRAIPLLLIPALVLGIAVLPASTPSVHAMLPRDEGDYPTDPDDPPPKTPTTTPGDADRDGIQDTLEDSLMLKFAPVVSLHRDETSLPANVDWYLSRVALRFHHDGGCSDDAILGLGSVTQSNLSQQSHSTKGGWPFCSHNDDLVRSSQSRNTFSDEGFFLQPPNTNGFDSTVHRGSSNPADWKAYAHVKKSSYLSGGYDIQYWFFYPYNDSPEVAGIDLNHEGDWEHITVTVYGNETFHSAYYAAHDNEGKRYDKAQLIFANHSGTVGSDQQKLTGEYTHPVVYSAIGSHASYNNVGSHYRGTVLPSDQTLWGKQWVTRNNVVNVGEAGYPLNNQRFILYGGLWGELGETTASTGPKGPAFQSYWTSW
ncbi:Vps62-related protein [Paenibacillus chartarius]|uniref:Vps62-related protein n=1 Tax=Paenibacillus chartarius TaxID=747481 RepID=A0ABV6DRA0_9BACL